MKKTRNGELEAMAAYETSSSRPHGNWQRIRGKWAPVVSNLGMAVQGLH